MVVACAASAARVEQIEPAGDLKTYLGRGDVCASAQGVHHHLCHQQLHGVSCEKAGEWAGEWAGKLVDWSAARAFQGTSTKRSYACSQCMLNQLTCIIPKAAVVQALDGDGALLAADVHVEVQPQHLEARNGSGM